MPELAGSDKGVPLRIVPAPFASAVVRAGWPSAVDFARSNQRSRLSRDQDPLQAAPGLVQLAEKSVGNSNWSLAHPEMLVRPQLLIPRRISWWKGTVCPCHSQPFFPSWLLVLPDTASDLPRNRDPSNSLPVACRD